MCRYHDMGGGEKGEAAAFLVLFFVRPPPLKLKRRRASLAAALIESTVLTAPLRGRPLDTGNCSLYARPQVTMSKKDFWPLRAPRSVLAFVLVAGVAFAAVGYGLPAGGAEPPAPAPTLVDTNSPSEALRSLLQLQEQLHGLQLRIEETRQQADTAAVLNAQAVASRLQALEQTLAAERAKDVDAVRSSNRMTLLVASTFGIIGFLAMVLMAYQWRSVSRLAEVSAGLPPSRLLHPGN